MKEKSWNKVFTNQQEILWILDETSFSTIFNHTQHLLSKQLQAPSYKTLRCTYKKGEVKKRSQMEKIVLPRKTWKIIKSLSKVGIKWTLPEEFNNFVRDYWRVKDTLIHNLVLDEEVMNLYEHFIQSFSIEYLHDIEVRSTKSIKQRTISLLTATHTLDSATNARELHTLKKNLHVLFSIYFISRRDLVPTKNPHKQKIYTLIKQAYINLWRIHGNLVRDKKNDDENITPSKLYKKDFDKAEITYNYFLENMEK